MMMVLPLMMTGKAYAQEKGQLIRYDLDAFEKTVKATDQYKSDPNVLLLAKDVFRTYCERKDVKVVDFTEKDYDDAKKELKRLQEEIETLQKAKDKVAEDLENEKSKVTTAETEKKELQNQIEDLNKQLSDKPGLEKQIQEKDQTIAGLNQQIQDLNGQIASQKTKLTENDTKLKELASDTVSLNKDKQELQKKLASAEEEKTSLENQLKEKAKQIESLNGTIAGLQATNSELTQTNAKYQAAFNNTKNTINGIYNENISKPIVDMNPVQLDNARSTYEGMKPLLAIDPNLSRDLEGKVSEINTWKALIEPLKGAKQYMKGKYDEKQRMKWVEEINKIPLAGSKAKEEVKEGEYAVLTLLENQAKLKKNYDLIVYNLEQLKSLPDEEALKDANTMFGEMQGYVKRYYKEGIYVGYDNAIKKIADALKSPPSDKVSTTSKFKLFIQELKEAF